MENWGRHKYLFASPGNLCNSVWICQHIFKCLNDLYGQSWSVTFVHCQPESFMYDHLWIYPYNIFMAEFYYHAGFFPDQVISLIKSLTAGFH